MQKKIYCHYCGGRLSQKFMEGKNRLFCESCNKPIYENPVPASCIVVPNNKGNVLLVKRSVEPKKGYWCLPGGFMELGENPDQSALRELEEETGLSGRIDMLLGITSNVSPVYFTVLMMGYLVKDYTGTLKAGDDAADAAWFHPEELPEIAFESHLKFIRTYYAAYAV